MLVDLRIEPFFLQQMQDIDSCRLWVWHNLTLRGEAHAAHLILATGLTAMEALRVIDRPIAQLGYANGDILAKALGPWCGALMTAAQVLGKYRIKQTVLNRLRSLHNACIGMIEAASKKPILSECSKIEPGSCLAPKATPCESAPSTDAGGESQTPCSPASHTGTRSPENCGTAFLTPTSPTVGESLGLPNSGADNATSSSKRASRGRGHAKRATPYTRGSGKQLP